MTIGFNTDEELVQLLLEPQVYNFTEEGNMNCLYFREWDKSIPSYLKRKSWKKCGDKRLFRVFILFCTRGEGSWFPTRKYLRKELREKYLVK